VKVEKIPGDHFTYMRQPQVRQLAALLAKHLDTICRNNNQAGSHDATGCGLVGSE
jgi:thioesterase domain-containing protein